METNPEGQLAHNPEPNEFSPVASTGRRLVLDTAAARGIDQNRTRQLLWLINAPPELSDLADVLLNLSDILAVAEAQWPGILSYQGLETLPELIRELQPVVTCILAQLAAHGHELHRDWVSRNALYCALRCSLSPTQNLQARYRLLQAHFLFAHTAILLRNARLAEAATSVTDYEAYGGVEEWPALGVAPYRAGLCIRQMAQQKHSQWAAEFLEKLPITLTPRELPVQSTVTMTSLMKGFFWFKKR